MNPNELIYSVNAKIHRELKIYVKVMGKDILSSPLIANKDKSGDDLMNRFSQALDSNYEKKERSTYYCEHIWANRTRREKNINYMVPLFLTPTNILLIGTLKKSPT